MYQNNLAIILDGNITISGLPQVKINNPLISTAKNKISHEILNNKLIKIAIKPNKIRISINNIILSDEIPHLPMQNNMNIKQTYVATTKKDIIFKVRKLLTNFNNLKSMVVEKEEPKIKPFEETIQADNNQVQPPLENKPPVTEQPTTFFDFNQTPTIDKIQTVEQKPIENIPTFNINQETNLQNSINETLTQPLDLNKNKLPEQTISNTFNDIPTNNNAGHIRSKLVPIIMIVIFLGVCVFAAYEAINYLKVTGKI